MLMFNATIVDTKNWRTSIDAIAALIDEGTFKIDEKGMRLTAMDPSQIALIDFELPASAFEDYSVEKTLDMGVDFTELAKITKRLRPEDKLHLQLDKRLKMTFEGDTKRTFTLSIIDAQSTSPKQPQIEFTSEVKLAPAMIKEALKDAELVSNHVALSCDDKNFNVASDGDTGSVDISLPDEKLLSLECDEDCRSVYSLEHLEHILKSAESPSIVTLKMRTDAPIKIEYKIGDAQVTYYLAPRIESS
ncbi:MAG: proliferating cell nuclear antigen (pcna) [Candidatus Altiarchaeales archaeon]|nr:proliferating cell nuclear antigen (pcna) [Candidatus Altiarchaeales archaeon]